MGLSIQGNFKFTAHLHGDDSIAFYMEFGVVKNVRGGPDIFSVLLFSHCCQRSLPDSESITYDGDIMVPFQDVEVDLLG